MPYVPDYVTNKTAQRVQTIFAVVGIFFGLAAFGGFSAGDPGGGFTCAAIAAASIFIAAKIKTKKKYIGGSGHYR